MSNLVSDETFNQIKTNLANNYNYITDEIKNLIADTSTVTEFLNINIKSLSLRHKIVDKSREVETLLSRMERLFNVEFVRDYKLLKNDNRIDSRDIRPHIEVKHPQLARVIEMLKVEKNWLKECLTILTSLDYKIKQNMEFERGL